MSQTYSFKDVSASLTGPTGTLDLGYGSSNSDEGISVDIAGDKNTMMIGADGNGLHTLHADMSGSIIVRYLKVSPLNAALMAMYDAQAVSASLWGANVIVVRQTASGDVTVATACAFKRKPNLNYKKDGDVIEWTFESVKIASVLGTY
jgi:hypothetical protein